MTRSKLISFSPFAFLVSLFLPTAVFAQAYDGEWAVTESVNATACGEGTSVETYTAVVSQSGTTMTVTASGITRSGAFSGTTLAFTATYPEDGGSVSSSGTIVFNGNSASGSSTWTYTEGSLSCDGSSTLSASRVGVPAPQPTPAPTPPPTPVPDAPQMAFSTSGSSLSISWDAVSNAAGYLLYYAPYPSADPVASIDLGSLLSLSGDLPVGTAMYIALQAYSASGQGDVSNVGNFKIKGVDVIELANEDSDIAAIVYSSKNASAVLFNNSSTAATVHYRFGDNQSATLVSDVQGNPIQFDIAGHRFDYTYTGSQVRTTLTEPGGAQSSVLENNPFATALSKPSYRPHSCIVSAQCADTQAAVWDSADEAALEQSINSNGGAMQRISGSVLACPFWMPSSACQALEGYAADAENLVDRLTDSASDKVKRIGTRFMCTVDSSSCAQVAADKAPAAIVELEQFASASVQPDASFDVSGDSLKPDADSWASYLADSGFEMVDVPCAESVFASIRPECGGASGTPQNPGSGDGGQGGQPTSDPFDDPNLIVEAISECRDTGAGTLVMSGCYNSDGKRTGLFVWRLEGKVQQREYYVNGKLNGPYQEYGGLDTETPWLQYAGTYVDGKLHGTFYYYDSSGLIATNEFDNGVVVEGSSKEY